MYQTESSEAFLKRSKEIDNKTKLCYYFYIYSLQHASLIILSLAKMLNQEESLVLDERYRQMIEEDVPSGQFFKFEEAMPILTSNLADIDNLHKVTILLRKYFSIRSSSMPFKFQNALIVRLVELSHQQLYIQLRYQALRTLSFISMRQMHIQLAKNGALKLFFMLIRHEDVQLNRLAMFAIGNIANGYQWKLIGYEGLKYLLQFQRISQDKRTNQLLLWALAPLLICYRRQVEYQTVAALLPAYGNSVPQYVSQVWVRTMQFYFKDDKIRALFESEAVLLLLNYLQSQNKKLSQESLKLITTIIKDRDQYIDRLIDLDLIGHLAKLLEKQLSHRYYFRIAYLLSSLSQSANTSFKRLVAQSDVILKKLLAMPYKLSNDIILKADVCGFFYNIISLANPFRLYSLFKQFNFVCVFLDESEPRFIQRLIQYLPGVLDLGEKFKENGKNVFVERLKAEGAVEKWEYRLQCKDESLASTLLLILQKFVE